MKFGERISIWGNKLKKLQTVLLHTMLFVRQHMRMYSNNYLIFWIVFLGITFVPSGVAQNIGVQKFILLIIFAGCFYHFFLRLSLKFFTYVLGNMWDVEVNQENKEFTIKKLSLFNQKLITKTKKYFSIIFLLYIITIGKIEFNNPKFDTQFDSIIYIISMSTIMAIGIIYGSRVFIKAIIKRMPIMWNIE